MTPRRRSRYTPGQGITLFDLHQPPATPPAGGPHQPPLSLVWDPQRPGWRHIEPGTVHQPPPPTRFRARITDTLNRLRILP